MPQCPILWSRDIARSVSGPYECLHSQQISPRCPQFVYKPSWWVIESRVIESISWDILKWSKRAPAELAAREAVSCKARSWHSCEGRRISGSRSVLRSTVGRLAGCRTVPFLTVVSSPWMFKRYVSICGIHRCWLFLYLFEKKSCSLWAWWHTPVILACRRQEDCSQGQPGLLSELRSVWVP